MSEVICAQCEDRPAEWRICSHCHEVKCRRCWGAALYPLKLDKCKACLDLIYPVEPSVCTCGDLQSPEVRCARCGFSLPAETAQLEAANERIEQLEAALKKAIETIRFWHGLGLPESMEKRIWKNYQRSPDMKLINSARSPEGKR